MFDALLNLWPLWALAGIGWLAIRLGRVYMAYRRQTRRC